MLKLGKPQAAQINPENATELEAWMKTKLADTPYLSILRVIAEMLDSSAKGQNIYAIIGTTKDKSAISFTVKQDGGGDARYGDTMAGVSTAMADWL